MSSYKRSLYDHSLSEDVRSVGGDLIKICPHGTANEAEREKLYKICCIQFGRGPLQKVSATNADSKHSATDQPIMHGRNISRINKETLSRIVVYRAMYEPIPVWHLMKAQVKNLLNLDQGIDSGGSESKKAMFANMYATAKQKRFRSARHFSLASGLSDHPSLKELCRIEASRPIDLLGLDTIDGNSNHMNEDDYEDFSTNVSGTQL